MIILSKKHYITPIEKILPKQYQALVIQKGNDRPYQNINDKDYKYYMRGGDSFVPTPHGVLQGMFGHAPQSDVFFMFNIGNAGKPEIIGNKVMKWQVGLMGVNGGVGSRGG